MAILLFLSTVLIVYIAHYYLIYRRRYPIGPLPLPFIGNLYHVKPAYLHEYLDELGKEYGHCYTLFLPAPTLIMTDYKTIKEALLDQGDTFAGRTHTIPEILLQRETNIGVLISDGEVWKTQRKTSLRIFRNFGVGRNIMEQKIMSSVDEMVRQLESGNKMSVDMFPPIQLCVGNVINEMLFGFHYNQTNKDKFFHFVSVVTKHLQLVKDSNCILLCQAFPWMKFVPLIGYYGYRYVKDNIESYLNFIEEQVKEHTTTFDPDTEPENFVHAYLKEKEVLKTQGLTSSNLTALGVDFWLAGMETTSTSLRWFIAYMVNYPDVQEKVFEEIDRVIGQRIPSMEHRPDMPYTQSVILEMQRCCNMIPFLAFHRCTDDTTVVGKAIPKDSIIMAQIWSVLASEECFEQAQLFKPDRFIMEDGKTMNKELIEKNIVFGLGRRQCVGEALAKMELFLILVTLLQKYRFMVDVKKPDLRADFSTVLLPKDYTVRIENR